MKKKKKLKKVQCVEFCRNVSTFSAAAVARMGKKRNNLFGRVLSGDRTRVK
jgi:hypothetical protein